MKKKLIICICLFFMDIIAILFYFLYPRFKNASISVLDKSVSLKDFLTLSIFEDDSKIISDVSLIEYGKTGDYNVELSYKGKKYNVKLNIVDDVEPLVEVRNIQITKNEKVNFDDFIVNVYDHSKYDVSYDDSLVDYDNYGIYDVMIKVDDEYGNKSTKTSVLKINKFKETIIHELGREFSINELLFDHDVLYDDINLEELNIHKVGDYSISFKVDGEEYVSHVLVKDTTAPVINTKDITHYIGSKKISDKDFILGISDESNFQYKLSSSLESLKLGINNIKVIAHDEYGNKSEKEVTILLKNDDIGPVIKGAKKITIGRGTTYNYLTNIKSIDKVDGECEVIFDDSKVNKDEVGSYKLTYKSYDKSMNLSQVSVTVVVIPNDEEIDELFQKFYDKYLKGKSVLEMTKTIRSKIIYKKIKGVNPIWTGLSTMSGSCVVHAEMLNKALELAGIESMVITNTGGYHSWVLVKENGKWRHYDPTPGEHAIGPLTDAQKHYAPGIGNLYWDSSYPKAQ